MDSSDISLRTLLSDDTFACSLSKWITNMPMLSHCPAAGPVVRPRTSLVAAHIELREAVAEAYWIRRGAAPIKYWARRGPDRAEAPVAGARPDRAPEQGPARTSMVGPVPSPHLRGPSGTRPRAASRPPRPLRAQFPVASPSPCPHSSPSPGIYLLESQPAEGPRPW